MADVDPLPDFTRSICSLSTPAPETGRGATATEILRFNVSHYYWMDAKGPNSGPL
jgi:hypothetical protein